MQIQSKPHVNGTDRAGLAGQVGPRVHPRGRGGHVRLVAQPRSDGRSLIRVLDADRSLGAALSDEELGRARRLAVAQVADLSRGTYSPTQLFAGERLLALLVLEGMLVSQVTVAERRSGELVGPGAVLRPWDDFGRLATVPFEANWHVIQDARIALLDHRFLLTIARWPALIDTFVERVMGRAHSLALNAAIQCLPQVNQRLLMLFWDFADRFGRVKLDGIHLPLPLSHSDLAELVGAARPTVSIALRQLADEGQIWRNEDRTWILRKDPPEELGYLTESRESELSAMQPVMHAQESS